MEALSRWVTIFTFAMAMWDGAYGRLVDCEAMERREQCVEHAGEVVSVSGSQVRVLMRAQSACAGCHAKSVCGMHESAPREVEVVAPQGGYAVGDRVRVGVRASVGLLAVLLSYVCPAMLVIAALFILSPGLGVSEGLSALFSLVVLCVYYALLYAFRHRVGRRFEFYITSRE